MGKMTSKPIRLGRSCPKSVRGGAARIPKPNRVYNFNNFTEMGVMYSTRTRQGQPIGLNLTYGQMPAPLIGVSL